MVEISKIEEVINQSIIYLSNNTEHIVYGWISNDFKKEFDPNIDYRSQYAEWYSTTGFYDSKTRPQRILDKDYDEKAEKTSTNYLTFFHTGISMETTWGYGKYFDGESVQLTEKSEKLLQDISKIISDFLDLEVKFTSDVDVDYNDDMMINVKVKISNEVEKIIEEIKEKVYVIPNFEEVFKND